MKDIYNHIYTSLNHCGEEQRHYKAICRSEISEKSFRMLSLNNHSAHLPKALKINVRASSLLIFIVKLMSFAEHVTRKVDNNLAVPDSDNLLIKLLMVSNNHHRGK